jgi:hypothetical protein
MPKDKKEKKPKSKLLRYAGLAANLTLWHNSVVIDGPLAVAKFIKNEKEIKAAEQADQ